MLNNLENISGIENKKDDEINNYRNTQHIPTMNGRQMREIMGLCKIVDCDNLSIDRKLPELNFVYRRTKKHKNTPNTRRKLQLTDIDPLNIANLYIDNVNFYHNNQNHRRGMRIRRKRQNIDTDSLISDSKVQSAEVIRHKRQIIDQKHLTIVPPSQPNE